AGESAWGSARSDADGTWIVTGISRLSPSLWGNCGQLVPELSGATDRAAPDDHELSPQSPAPITVTSLLYLLQRDTETRSQARTSLPAPVNARHVTRSRWMRCRSICHDLTQNQKVIVGCIQSNRHEYARERQLQVLK